MPNAFVFEIISKTKSCCAKTQREKKKLKEIIIGIGHLRVSYTFQSCVESDASFFRSFRKYFRFTHDFRQFTLTGTVHFFAFVEFSFNNKKKVWHLNLCHKFPTKRHFIPRLQGTLIPFPFEKACFFTRISILFFLCRFVAFRFDRNVERRQNT